SAASDSGRSQVWKAKQIGREFGMAMKLSSKRVCFIVSTHRVVPPYGRLPPSAGSSMQTLAIVLHPPRATVVSMTVSEIAARILSLPFPSMTRDDTIGGVSVKARLAQL